MQRTLVIDRKNTRLDSKGTRLIISGENMKTKSIPINGLAAVFVVGNSILHSHTINLLSEHSVPTTIINSRNNKVSLIYGKPHKNSARRLNQYKLLEDAASVKHLALGIVKIKTLGQLNTLRQLKIHNPKHRRIMTDTFNKIQNQYQLMPSEPKDLDYIRGLEGACAAIYFKGFSHLFAPSLGFAKRVKRPPTDPVNALLSLSYTLLNCECSHALYAAGFDPMLGILHSVSYGRDSLACDMSELFRARIDRWVFKLFKQEKIRLEHFSINSNAESGDDHIDFNTSPCVLQKTGRQIFYANWQSLVRPLRRLIRQTAFYWNRQYL